MSLSQILQFLSLLSFLFPPFLLLFHIDYVYIRLFICIALLQVISFLFFRITSGNERVLFHMVQLEVGEGVMVQSIPPPASSSPTGSPSLSSQPHPPSLQAQVLNNFRSVCAHIHHVLHAAVRGKVCALHL